MTLNVPRMRPTCAPHAPRMRPACAPHVLRMCPACGMCSTHTLHTLPNREQALRSHLHSCGVTSEMQLLPSSALSGGQRSRVALAAVSYTAPHVLVLDEPTNNLDLESVASLADCIESFKGGVVLVSHDQYFVGRVAREVWVVDQGTVKKASSFDAYRAAQLAKLK